MPVSTANVTTSRAGRYLAQLCKHGGHMGRIAAHSMRSHQDGGAPPVVRRTEWSDTDGVIEFGPGRCTLHATADTLMLTVEADDQQRMQRNQDGITRRLERIGRRDQLTVVWSPAPPKSGVA